MIGGSTRDVDKFEEKHIDIEVMVVKETMKASSTTRQWMSSARQYANTLTKIQDQLLHDPNLQIAKTKDLQRKRSEAKGVMSRTIAGKTLVVSLALGRVTEAKAEDAEDVTGFGLMLLAILIVSVIIACQIGYRCGRAAARQSAEERTILVDTGVQGPVTYLWKDVEPRYRRYRSLSQGFRAANSVQHENYRTK